MIKNYVKKLIPKLWIHRYSTFINRKKSVEQVFTEIYQKNYWGKTDGAKYFSGTGTHDPNTLKYINCLTDFILKKNIESVFEIGCGDFTIMKQVLEKTKVNYTGTDVVADLILHLQKNYRNNQWNFLHFDAIKKKKFPDADLCIIRQVLQHLTNVQIIQILEKTKKFKYVIITEHVPVNPKVLNGDKSLSGYIRLQNAKTSGVFLDAPPFSLPCETLLSYRKDDENLNGKIIPALMLSSLITNNYSVTTSD